jgi:hypothetical protein
MQHMKHSPGFTLMVPSDGIHRCEVVRVYMLHVHSLSKSHILPMYKPQPRALQQEID